MKRKMQWTAKQKREADQKPHEPNKIYRPELPFCLKPG
jgi:hypothetical protein